MLLFYKNYIFKQLMVGGIAILFCLPWVSQAQQTKQFNYQSLNPSLIGSFYDEGRRANIPPNGYDLSKDLIKGRKASVNTQIIQQALNQNKIVILPNFPILISKQGLTLNTGNVLVFRVGSELVMEPNDLEYYQLLKIHNVSNVKIFNAKLKGDRNKHLSSEGEWGYGISIRSSSNILIDNFYIYNFWGDGIAIGYGTTSTSQYITLKNGFIDNNRRNGISVMNVNHLNADKILIANTNGTNPMFGIDFEPNNKQDNLNNIVLNNINTYNNAKGGLMLTFSNLKAQQPKEIGFTLTNYKDIGSPIGILLAGIPSEATGLYGKIKLDHIILEKNSSPIKGRTIYNDKVTIDIDNLDLVAPLNENWTDKEVKRVFDLKKNYSLKIR